MSRKRFDQRTFIIMLIATLIGAAWATYQRSLTIPPYDENELRPLVWIIFATPFALWIGWIIARRHEAAWASFVCFCMYFFSPFISQRYESCTVVSGSFNPVDCFAATAEAQQLANDTGHVIHFQAIVVIHVLIAIGISIHRGFHQNQEPATNSIPQAATQPSNF
jgi:hypothetical protein